MIKLYIALQNLNARRNEEGASAVEYGLLVAAIAAIVVAIVFLLGGVIEEVFTSTCEGVQEEADTTAACETA